MAMPVGLERQPSAALTLATQWSNQSNRSMRSEPRSPMATKESTPFTWSECHNLIPTDAAGVLVRQPPASSAAGVSGLKVSGRLQLPCNHLYHIGLYRGIQAAAVYTCLIAALQAYALRLQTHVSRLKLNSMCPGESAAAATASLLARASPLDVAQEVDVAQAARASDQQRQAGGRWLGGGRAHPWW